MLTIDEIKQKRSQVKSIADAPGFIKDIVNAGVIRYISYVVDGHTVYYSLDGHEVIDEPTYAPTQIAASTNREYFIKELKEYQNGKWDYLNFCRMCADVGVEKWIVDMELMTCTYCDKRGFEVLVEPLPVD